MNDDLTNGLSLAEHNSEVSGVRQKQKFPAGEEFLRYLGYSSGAVCGAVAPQFHFGIIGELLDFLGEQRDRRASTRLIQIRSGLIHPDLHKGERLDKIMHLSSGSRPILLEIIHHELSTTGEENHFSLVVLSSILFEREMGACLCERIRISSSEIIEEIKIHRSNFDTGALEAWSIGRTETTIGILVMLLHGIRWGLERGNTSIRHQIEDVFDARLLDVLASKSFALAANRIREDFRNPAIHGRKVTFTRDEYGLLSKLITSAESLSDWIKCDSNAVSADAGILQSHLVTAKRYP